MDIIKRRTNIEVVSCSKISRLNGIIPYIPFGEILKMIENNSSGMTVISKDSGHKKLSILICSLEERRVSLRRLLSILQTQTTDDVEILVATDSGRITTGSKRNLLLEQATGDYIVYIDDDDLVSDDYIPKILEAIKTNPDCCGMEGTLKRKRFSRIFIHSIKYNTWFEKEGIYYRCPNHLNPVKRRIALQVGFPEQNKGEDQDYSLRLYLFLKTEVYIKGSIYTYIKDYR